jgi:hypothetical protein
VIGLFDILKHLRKRKKRRKEWAIFLVMGFVNAIFALFWGAFVLTQNSIEILSDQVKLIQAQPILFWGFVFACIAGIWVVNWNVLNDWVKFRFSATIVFLTALFVVIFANPPIESSWRIVVVAILFALLGLEFILQILTIPGWLPSFYEFQSGMYHPYGRVYQTDEGYTNAMMNRYGLYQPDIKLNLDQNVRRIVLIGGSFIQGFQVLINQHFSQQLAQILNLGRENSVQIFALGMPDAGIGIYMHDLFMDIVIEKFQPDEIIFFLHLSSDFQCEACPISDGFLYSYSSEDDSVEIRPGDGGIQHALQHIVLRGYYDTSDPLRSVKTHLFLPKFIRALLTRTPTISQSKQTESDDAVSTYIARIIRKFRGKREYYQDFIAVPSVNAAGIRNFLFTKEITDEAKESFAITKALYKQIIENLKSRNVKSRVVSIPAFSQKFFKQDEREWTSTVGDLDLFFPEQEFQEFAFSRGIDFLAMGAQLKKDQLMLAQIKSFYFQDGMGHLTPSGHEYFAKSIHAAFYESK